MTHDDDDDRNLPALSRRPTPPAVASARDLLAAPAVNGIVQSAISGFMADMRRRSLQKHGQAVGAFADLQSERTRVVRNTIELASEVGGSKTSTTRCSPSSAPATRSARKPSTSDG